MTAAKRPMLSSQRAAIRSRWPRSRENAVKSTSAIGIAMTVNGRMTVLIAKVQARDPTR